MVDSLSHLLEISTVLWSFLLVSTVFACAAKKSRGNQKDEQPSMESPPPSALKPNKTRQRSVTTLMSTTAKPPPAKPLAEKWNLQIKEEEEVGTDLEDVNENNPLARKYAAIDKKSHADIATTTPKPPEAVKVGRKGSSKQTADSVEEKNKLPRFRLFRSKNSGRKGPSGNDQASMVPVTCPQQTPSMKKSKEEKLSVIKSKQAAANNRLRTPRAIQSRSTTRLTMDGTMSPAPTASTTVTNTVPHQSAITATVTTTKDPTVAVDVKEKAKEIEAEKQTQKETEKVSKKKSVVESFNAEEKLRESKRREMDRKLGKEKDEDSEKKGDVRESDKGKSTGKSSGADAKDSGTSGGSDDTDKNQSDKKEEKGEEERKEEKREEKMKRTEEPPRAITPLKKNCSVYF